ncbi:hypothetical protein LAZ67_15003205 [Cordylochernes scorpioides]|uniref:CCHC-type domain-containing protein n=1 Tax=Cordylochernes scorpioides TaxID=51811 RepID=A0ABY6LBC2_9ARAC|nr:hypothetical protein LAZ67_15003205 [Cordylochernes scorpioides]
MPSSASPGTSGSAGQEPGRPSIPSPTGVKKSNKNEIQKIILRENSENRIHANPPAGVKDVNLAAARDVTLDLPAGTSSNGAARALRNWADCPEDQGPGADDDFTVVRTKKRRRESANSPTAAAPSSNIGSARTSRRPQSSAGSVPRAQEVRTTRAHITEARARQASSSEDHCIYLEHGPELQPFHYLRALDRMLGGTAGVIQVSKVNGHQLLGLANRDLAERLINEGLEVEGTLLRAFPFRKRAERITVGNLPFFVEDSAIISALKPYGRVTSIAPKLMKAGPYTYNDGRREAFIVLREGMTTERLPTRLEIPIKGEAWPAYLSSGIKCSRCHGQGHRRANCPLLAGRANNYRLAPPTSPAGVPSTTTSAPPQRSAAQPPAPAPSSTAMEIPGASHAARAVTPSAAPRPSTPVASAVPMEMAPPAPPPVAPAPSLRAPGSHGPAVPTLDVEMSIEETSTSRAALKTSPAAVPPTPPLPAPQPAGPIPPAPDEEEMTPTMREECMDLPSTRVGRGAVARGIHLRRLHPPPMPELPGPFADLNHRRDQCPEPPWRSPALPQEIRATRAHIADARARQASSSEEHCVYIEHSPELEPFHYLRALDRKLGGTAGVIQITKVNGHQLLGLTNRGLAERLISEGLEVEGTLLRAFPFRKRAERITVGNLPFFVADSAVITALSPYGRVKSIAPKQMKAGPYVYVDGRRDVFITLHEGITIERLPTRLDINIKGQAWPAYLSSGIRCSRCHGQGHRRAICPLLAGLANNTRMAPPTTPAGVPPPTTSAPPQRSAAQPPAPAPSNLAMEVCSAPPMARAVLHPSAPRPSPPAAPALPMEETPSAPPPVIPAPSLQAPEGSVGPLSANSQHPEPPPARPDFVAPRDPLPAQKTLGPAAPTPDVEMSIVEETSASSTSLAKNATRVDLDAFIERHPSVSFAGTDALGLGREEVLDLLSSRTKAQRKGPLLSPPQCDALAGLISQILDLRPGAASNLYKVLGQALSRERFSEPLSNIGVTEGDIVEAIIFPEDREPLFRHLSTQKRTTLAEIISAASECARNSDPFDHPSDIAEARARQASSTEDHCVYVERSPELEPFHYMRAIERMFGRTREVFQLTKMNGHFLVGLANRGMAERLINEGLERITVGNLPFFVGDAAVISALSSFGRVTSIAPKLMKAGPYIYNDGRREAFIIFREGMTIERLPTRLDITIKGEAWPAYLSSGIRCSRCRGQGHRRANCPLLAGLANNTRLAPPTTPAAVPSTTTSSPPQRSAAQPPTPASSSPARETPGTSPAARAVTTSTAPRPSPPVAPAVPMEEAPSTPPPVTPAPSLHAPGGPAQRTLGSAAPTPDVEMSIVEETFASSTSSAKNATRVDLDAFIEGHPSVSFAETDALGLGREEVLDLLSSRTKAQRKGPLLSPPQCDALVGVIGQILNLRPGAASNLYKVLGQVKAELRTTPAEPPTPPLPAPRPSGPTPPTPHSEELMPAVMTPPPPALEDNPDLAQWEMSLSLYQIFMKEPDLGPTSKSGIDQSELTDATLNPRDREELIEQLLPRQRNILAQILDALLERALDLDPFLRGKLSELRASLPP